MIIVLRPNASEHDLDQIVAQVTALGLTPHVSRGVSRTIIGCIGDEDRLREVPVLAFPAVETILPVEKPYKLAAREFVARDTEVTLGGAAVGDGAVHAIAGPCSVEGPDMLLETAEAVKAAGAVALRGGAFKPRTSPYTFQGKGVEGLELLRTAADAHGLPIVTELMDPRMLETFLQYDVDVIQIGTRNMQNFDLLKEVGRTTKPVVLKRGMSATISEWLMAAEYIAAGGNHNIIFCERGIRTFETAYRNVLDVTAVPVLKRETHLPVIVDPSHAGGKAWMVPALSCAAVAAGADGLLIEVHPNPCDAWCDADQALTLTEFATLMGQLGAVARAVGREL